MRSFLDRQSAHTKTDYQLLREALIKEFSDPESEQELEAALETRQGRHEPHQFNSIQVYLYSAFYDTIVAMRFTGNYISTI